jgi:hypothetical protein
MSSLISGWTTHFSYANIAKCTLAIGAVGLTSFFQRQLLPYNGSIGKRMGLSYGCMTESQKIVSWAISWFIMVVFFTKPDHTYIQFVKDNRVWIGLDGLRAICGVTPIAKLLGLEHPAPSNFSKGSWLTRVTYPNSHKTSDGDYLTPAIEALKETAIFRVIIQALLFRALPQLFLKVTGIASPDMVDSKFFTESRIVAVACMWAGAKVGAGRNSYHCVNQIMFLSLVCSNLQERVGPLAAFIPHLAFNLTQRQFP